MSLFTQIQADLVTAQKAREADKVSALRLMVNDIKNVAINAGGDRENISDDDAIKALNKAVKQRKDSIQVYTENSRQDLADVEQKELDIIQSYLPQMMSEDEIEAILIPIVRDAEDKNFGMLMKKAMEQLRGKADAGVIKNVIERLVKNGEI